jgi:hypothetical protein
MKTLLAATLLLSTPALAGTTASISSSAKSDFLLDESERETKYTTGISFAAYTKGLAYWTWNGIGYSDDNYWGSTQHGLDFSAGPVKIGPTLEYKLSEKEDDELNLGVRAAIKLW